MEIDRSKVCPLLLRCFWKLNRGYPLSAYRETTKDIFPSQEIQIYSWKDATLNEIAGLLKDVVPAARESGSILSFSLVFLDKNGNFDIKQVGKVFSLKSSPDDDKTLRDLNFVTGDYLDIAVLPARGAATTPRGGESQQNMNRSHNNNNNSNMNNNVIDRGSPRDNNRGSFRDNQQGNNRQRDIGDARNNNQNEGNNKRIRLH